MVKLARRLALGALLASAALAGTGCPPAGTSCGRGRCHSGACLNVISTYTDFQELSPDWWCAVPCDGTLACAGEMCLQSPIDSTLEVCAGDQLEVKYHYKAGVQKIPREGELTIIGVNLVRPGQAPVPCEPDTLCNAGWIRSGELLPEVWATSNGSDSFTVVNGSPGEAFAPAESAVNGEVRGPLGPLLPTGMDIVIHIGGPVDKFF